MVLFVVAAAHAGGYFYSDAGIVATGRGGAWVAGADTQFAQYYNPAGLIRIESPSINIGWSGVQQNVSFTRLGDDRETFLPEVRNQASPFDVPELGFATPIGSKVALAVGFYSPFAPSSLYDEEGPQRYSIKDTTIYQFSIGPSAAFRVHPMLTLGVGLQWQYLQIGETVDVTLTGQDDPAGDIAVEARAADTFTPNANAGLLFEPHHAVSIGLAVQAPTSFSAHGTGSLDFEGNAFATLLDQTSYTDDDIRLNIDIPWVVRAGVAVRPIERLEIEAAVVWQDWSSLDDIVIEDIDVTVASSSPLIPEDQRTVDDSISLPAGLNDTVSLRLGAEADLDERLAVRAGGFWENSALTPEEVSVALVDTPKVQLGAGATVWAIPRRLRFDAAFAWLFFHGLEIRDSTVTQIDAGVLEGTTPLVVGNGDLRSHGWVIGLAGQLSFPGKDEVTEPVPTLIVAGYLGSGKTTLVDHLLRAAQREGVRLAIVSNEFGDTGIDRALLDAGEDGLVELDGGCVCCRLSDVLSTTLQTLIERVKPDRLVLECSGVALPGEIVIQFWRPPLDALVSDEVVVVVVDAERAAEGAQDETWIEQLEAADLVILNKVDRVDADGLSRARARVDATTAGRPVIAATFAKVDPGLLFPPDPEGARKRRRDPNVEPHAHDHERFTTRELRFDGVTDEAEILARVAAMDAIRAKGFVLTERGLRVLQGVGERIELTVPTRPVPDELVGMVVVIHREPG